MSQTVSASDQAGSAAIGPSNQTWALFLVSVLGLFLELMLIRWIGTEIRIFAYLQNTVLVVCFMGLGMGCATSRRPFVLREMLIPLFAIVLLLAVPVSRIAMGNISQLLSAFSDMDIWYQEVVDKPWQTGLYAALGLLLTFALMVLIWDIFVPVGRLLGRLLDDHPRTIWAYSVNIAGSLLGIWLFVLLSVFYLPPIVWLGLAAAMMVFFLSRPGRARTIELALLAGIVLLGWPSSYEVDVAEVKWSPYQKLALQNVDSDRPAAAGGFDWSSLWIRKVYPPFGGVGDYTLTVNNVGYQVIVDLSAEEARKNPERLSPEVQGFTQYDFPFLLHPSPQKALLVGAGSGNDAAGALRNGAKEIVAVEIDPAIISMGRRYHPEKPYDSPLVKVVIDDARSFFAGCNDRFDVISFGLLDSHTMTTMTNARLDHYVYTRESIERAKSLLTDRGIMVLSFAAQKPFIADRMASVIREVFGAEPISFRVPSSHYGWGGVTFVAGDLPAVRKQLADNPKLASLISQWQRTYPLELTGTTRIATDDWPYIYLKAATIPVLYLCLAGMLLVLMARCSRRLQLGWLITGWNHSHWHFFFMGAAFLLLEVQNISKASVVLGNTWLVNAVIISGILAMVLLSNWIVARFPGMPAWPAYGLLIATCLGLYFVDISRFAFLPYAAKASIVGALTSLPMLFSGIVFIRSFANVRGKDVALGANLIGALVGGLLQSITFMTGIKALLLIVAGLYLAALLTRPRSISPTPAVVPTLP